MKKFLFLISTGFLYISGAQVNVLVVNQTARTDLRYVNAAGRVYDIPTGRTWILVDTEPCSFQLKGTFTPNTTSNEIPVPQQQGQIIVCRDNPSNKDLVFCK